VKYIPLTGTDKCAIIDDDDFLRVSKNRWQLSDNGYARRTIKVKGVYKGLLLHRFILGITDRKIWTDHINQNKLDCRKSNLRACTASQNKQNIGVRSHNVSRYKGVEYRKDDGRYTVRIGIDGKMLCLGSFKNPIDAAKAYNEKAKELFGEFAYLNNV
jgi:hypothetical protein